MQLRRQLERRRGEVVVTQSVLDRSPKRQISRQLLRIEIERQHDLPLRSLRQPSLGTDPVRHRMSGRDADERRPIRLYSVRQQLLHVDREPVCLPRVVEGRTKVGDDRAVVGVLHRPRPVIRKCRLDRAQSRVQLLRDRQGLSRRVRDHVRVRKPVLLVHPIEDLDLKLKRCGIGGAPPDCLFVADTRLSQARVPDAGEMVAA